MGPLFAFVCYCFRENAIVACKIGFVMCSLDIFLRKTVTVLIFENHILKWRSFEKQGYF